MNAASKKLTAKNKENRLLKHLGKIFFWIFLALFLPLLALYIILLFTPISLQYFRAPIQQAAINALPDNYEVELGSVSLALERGFLPTIRFSPATIIDKDNGAQIKLAALDVSFSPIRAIIGQPSLNISLVRPNLQIIQDLLGPRLAEFEIVEEKPNSNEAAIYILEGNKSYPRINITARGIDFHKINAAGEKLELRTDNALAIFNFQAAEQSLATFQQLVSAGKISKLQIIDAKVDMHDSVYGLLRQFENINLKLYPIDGNNNVAGEFSLQLASRKTSGKFRRQTKDNLVKLLAEIENIDFSSILPFLDDKNSIFALEGAGNINLGVSFDKQNSKLLNGEFTISEINSNFRINNDYYPVRADKINILWDPDLAKFSLEPTNVRIGNSSGKISADFISGVDEMFGPTMRMSVEAERVFIYPNDLLAPQNPFDKISLIGWSAPLYGATGIDYLLAKREGVEFRAKGRFDIVQRGIGLNLEIGGEGAYLDDLKRLWPYFIATDARKWFIKNVKTGRLKSANMVFNFPIGSIGKPDEALPLPKGAINIEMIGENVSLIPLKGMQPINIEGDAKIRVTDNIVNFAMQGSKVPTKEGDIIVKNGRVILDSSNPDFLTYNLFGNVNGAFPSLLTFIRAHLPDILDESAISINLNDLRADVETFITTNIVVEKDRVKNVKYSAIGNISDFLSLSPIANFTLDKGEFAFSATQNGFEIDGKANIANLPIEIKIDGILGQKTNIYLFNELTIAEIKQLGFDLSSFMKGKIKFAIKILEDEAIQLAADIRNASLNIADIGLKKEQNVNGELNAIIKQREEQYLLSDINLSFNNVRLKGDLLIENNALKSANFPTFILNKNDDASLSIEPMKNGYALNIRGKRMDLKPTLNRAFSLTSPSAGGVRSTQYKRRLLLDIKLQQAIGFYKVIANNFNLKMDLRGEEIYDVSLQTQFSQNNAVSISTNQTEESSIMSVAFNDAGILLRFLNVYPRLLGGRGSFVLTTNKETKIGLGKIFLRDFSIVDEEKLAEILGNHPQSRTLIARENKISFNYGKADFIRRSDRIEIINAVLDGGEVGGTLRGFIYTKDNQYDLSGTYIPLFGLNSIFQKLPLFGAVLGGREGEGLIGVTFAIRGSLDSPKFIINPASILAPGMFRSLFEFRSREIPRPKE